MTRRAMAPNHRREALAPAAIVNVAQPLLRRPDLWPTAIRSYRSLVPRRWWRHHPFLPLPDADWMHFRLVTAYGGDGIVADDAEAASPDLRLAHDLIVWLEWLREWNRGQQRSRR
ncbi:MAG: hypothetical protein OER95_16205 [Acidimicrobiia bacterium]|nr:hypothetical protein [Acidimicrobiia bacterium]